MGRDPEAARERTTAASTGRLERQSAVMRAFVTRPAGTVLDADELATTTGLEPRQVGGVCRVLVEGGWLQPVRSDLDHRAWQRPPRRPPAPRAGPGAASRQTTARPARRRLLLPALPGDRVRPPRTGTGRLVPSPAPPPEP
jgi:hypothetical protein